MLVQFLTFIYQGEVCTGHLAAPLQPDGEISKDTSGTVPVGGYFTDPQEFVPAAACIFLCLVQ